MRVFLRTEKRSILAPGRAAAPSARGAAAPARPLEPFVEHLRWGRERFAAPVTERVLPDGAVHLLFDLGEAPSAMVAGARAVPTTIRLAGTVDHLGIELRPGGMAAVLGVPAGELAGRLLSLDELWGRDAARVLAQLVEAPAGARLAIATAALVERVRAARGGAEVRAAQAAQLVRARRGRVQVRELADALGVGERRVEQLFQRDVGLSPRAFARVARFRHLVDTALDAALDAPPASWAALALACGYYDQAHLTNDVRALTGMSPGQLAAFGFFQDPRLDAP